ncbi:MAG: AAA family ATPase [Deltaproteobacteria bacterium]|nr:AAA family ATPase [Deltaproteobacteria bacterium]MBI3387419.1 AAA family ATPase [Deltaproteobacteria bacterium]
MAESRIEITDNLDLLLAVLPPRVRQQLEAAPVLDTLIEIVLDLGRPPEARFPSGVMPLNQGQVTREDLDYMVARIGAFTKDNRAGIERTLHRISALRNRFGEIIGLTCRVGRAVYGTVEIVRDVIEAGKSVLILGRPGVGKTTLLREAARVLADDLGRRVVIVDTSNEIAGDGDIPHPGIGRARRMQVPTPDLQHAVMIEAVENHMPEVVVIDEIGTEAEALAARTIAERGVQLIATAHGNTLENLITNPTLADLIGGIQSVTLGDDEARRRRTQKTVLERKAPPTFDMLIEIHSQERFAVHSDVAKVVDALLRQARAQPELRLRRPDGGFDREAPRVESPTPMRRNVEETGSSRRPVRIFPYAISRDRLERAIHELDAAATVCSHPRDADLVLTLRALSRKHPKKLRELMTHNVPVHAVNANTVGKLMDFLREHLEIKNEELDPDQQAALREAEDAIACAIAERRPVELGPQNAYVRRLQHQLVEAYGLASESVGAQPFRRLLIRPTRTPASAVGERQFTDPSRQDFA